MEIDFFNMSKIAIFASGEGSNARQILRFLKQKKSSVQVSMLITNKASAGIHLVAAEYNTPIHVFSNADFVSSEKVLKLLKDQQVEWVVLAGFLRKIEAAIVEKFENKIINLHPSLLPKFGGKGMYGYYVHQAVIDSGESESGITIHLVNGEFDKGAILFQAKCSIEKGQTVAELMKKVQKLEHCFFPEVIEKTILAFEEQ